MTEDIETTRVSHTPIHTRLCWGQPICQPCALPGGKMEKLRSMRLGTGVQGSSVSISSAGVHENVPCPSEHGTGTSNVAGQGPRGWGSYCPQQGSSWGQEQGLITNVSTPQTWLKVATRHILARGIKEQRVQHPLLVLTFN